MKRPKPSQNTAAGSVITMESRVGRKQPRPPGLTITRRTKPLESLQNRLRNFALLFAAALSVGALTESVQTLRAGPAVCSDYICSIVNTCLMVPGGCNACQGSRCGIIQ